jgi:hypothetical protein
VSNQVYANAMELSCKSAAGKSVCAFPDVCFTPPQTPATPPGVPVPYPNSGMASDCSDGSSTVKISGEEIMLKDKSYFKKSTGDEAGSAPKKGVVTSKNTGKVYFTMWSMDVKAEGENVVRHLDMTTHNHGSSPGNSPPWAYADAMATTPIKECVHEVGRAEHACKGKATKAERCADKDCRNASKCLLVTKSQADSEAKKSRVACCDGETGHHIIEAHGFTERGSNRKTALPQFPDYREADAPCICAECPQDGSGRYEGDHGFMHALVGKFEQAAIERAPGQEYAWTYKEAKAAGIRSVQQTFTQSGCSKKCLEAQLDSYHKSKGVKENTPIRTETPKLTDSQKDLAHELVPEVTLSKW